MDKSESINDENDLRAAVQFAVIQACKGDEVDDVLQLQHDDSTATMTPAAIATLSELAYVYATSCLGPDLESFRDHSNRRTVTVSDVLLVARKLPTQLQDKLHAFCNEHCSATAAAAPAAAGVDATTRPKPKKTSSSSSRPINLQRKKKPTDADSRMDVSEQSSTSSSSEDDDLMDFLSTSKAKKNASSTTIRSRPLKAASHNLGVLKDTDDEVEVLGTTLPPPPAKAKDVAPPQKNRKIYSLDDSTEDEVEVDDDEESPQTRLRQRAALPLKRFRLKMGTERAKVHDGTSDEQDNASRDELDDDDDDDDDCLLAPSFERSNKQSAIAAAAAAAAVEKNKPSAVADLLLNLSQDSTFSQSKETAND